jgi:hypothetical protein
MLLVWAEGAGKARNWCTAMKTPQITVPNMCQKHQWLLVKQAGYKESDPWRALIIMAQIALFQGATADPVFHEKTGGNIEHIDRVGCLACFKPDCFGAIVEAAKSPDPGAIKLLGESWLQKKGEANG